MPKMTPMDSENMPMMNEGESESEGMTTPITVPAGVIENPVEGASVSAEGTIISVNEDGSVELELKEIEIESPESEMDQGFNQATEKGE